MPVGTSPTINCGTSGLVTVFTHILCVGEPVVAAQGKMQVGISPCFFKAIMTCLTHGGQMLVLPLFKMTFYPHVYFCFSVTSSFYDWCECVSVTGSITECCVHLSCHLAANLHCIMLHNWLLVCTVLMLLYLNEHISNDAVPHCVHLYRRSTWVCTVLASLYLSVHSSNVALPEGAQF